MDLASNRQSTKKPSGFRRFVCASALFLFALGTFSVTRAEASYKREKNKDYSGINLAWKDGYTLDRCEQWCLKTPKCLGYTFLYRRLGSLPAGRCHLKSKIGPIRSSAYCHSGTRLKKGTSPSPLTAKPAARTKAKTTGKVTKITVSYGAFSLPECQLTKVGSDRYSMKCQGISQKIEMKGTLKSGDLYNLESSTGRSFQDLVNWGFKKLVPNKLHTIVNAFSSAVPLPKVYLALDNQNGFFLKGKVNFKRAGKGGNNIQKAFHATNKFLGKYIPGYKPEMEFELIPSLSNQELSLSFKVSPFSMCVGPPKLKKIGSQFKFNKGTMIFALKLAAVGGASVSAAMEGTAYIKPSKKDPWLMYKPTVEFGFSAGAGTDVSMTLKGNVSGACRGSCANNCSCNNVHCTNDWNPLGLKFLALKEGTIEVGVSLTEIGAVPSVTFAFMDARIGDSKGTFVGAFDYGAKAFGFQVKANKMYFIQGLAMLTAIDSIKGKIPNELAIHNFTMSYSTAGLSINTVSVPAGMRMAGTLKSPGAGITGTLDVTLSPPFPTSLEQMKSGEFLYAMFGVPRGKFEFSFDMSGLYDKLMSVKELKPFVSIIKKTYSLRSIGISIGFQQNKLTTGGSASFSLFGKQFDPKFDISVTLSPADLAKKLGSELKKLVTGPLSQAFNEAKKALGKAGKAVKDAAVTAGKEVAKVSKDAARAIDQGAKEAGKALIGSGEKIASVFKKKNWFALRCKNYKVKPGCYIYRDYTQDVWVGTAPSCKGENGCRKAGGSIRRAVKSGVGSRCLSGKKALCRKTVTCRIPTKCGGEWAAPVGQTLTLNCESSKVILVLKTVFGNKEKKCTTNAGAVPRSCNRKANCSIKVTTSTGGNTRICQGKTGKMSLHVTYICLSSRDYQKVMNARSAQANKLKAQEQKQKQAVASKHQSVLRRMPGNYDRYCVRCEEKNGFYRCWCSPKGKQDINSRRATSISILCKRADYENSRFNCKTGLPPNSNHRKCLCAINSRNTKQFCCSCDRGVRHCLPVTCRKTRYNSSRRMLECAETKAQGSSNSTMQGDHQKYCSNCKVKGNEYCCDCKRSPRYRQSRSCIPKACVWASAVDSKLVCDDAPKVYTNTGKLCTGCFRLGDLYKCPACSLQTSISCVQVRQSDRNPVSTLKCSVKSTRPASATNQISTSPPNAFTELKGNYSLYCRDCRKERDNKIKCYCQQDADYLGRYGQTMGRFSPTSVPENCKEWTVTPPKTVTRRVQKNKFECTQYGPGWREVKNKKIPKGAFVLGTISIRGKAHKMHFCNQESYVMLDNGQYLKGRNGMQNLYTGKVLAGALIWKKSKSLKGAFLAATKYSYGTSYNTYFCRAKKDGKWHFGSLTLNQKMKTIQAHDTCSLVDYDKYRGLKKGRTNSKDFELLFSK